MLFEEDESQFLCLVVQRILGRREKPGLTFHEILAV